MAWGWGNQQGSEEAKDEDVSKASGSSLSDMANVSVKIQGLLDNVRNKFEDKYKDVKLGIALPVLLQLMDQAKAQRPSDQEFSRDIVYNKSGTGTESNSLELQGLGEGLDYADWAYLSSTKDLEENLQSKNFSLLKHEKAEEAGSVGYFIAINPESKTALIGIKGTSSLSDLLTDCCAATASQTLDRSFIANDDSFKEIRAHEGILISANALAQSLNPFVKDLFIPLQYKLLLCGHSLGAGAATLTAVILRSRHPELLADDRITVKAFASPPVLDHKAANACSSFVTTIVNNSDVVTRASLNNVEVLFEVLAAIQGKLIESGLDPVNIQSTAAYLSMLRKGSDGEMIITTEEGFALLDKAQSGVAVDDPNHLYVGGKVILLYRKWQDRKKRKESLEAMRQTAKDNREKFVEAEARKELDPLPVYSVLVDSAAEPLLFIEIDEDMVTDHLTTSYHAMVDGTLKTAS